MMNMETDNCNITHLYSDAHLPPRKRFLAGFRRQSCDFNCPAPSTSHTVDTTYDTRLDNLLKATIDNPELPNDDIVETSRSAAAEAARVAVAARANAEMKAAKAAKAMAVARIALDLVASLSEEAARGQKSVRKSKMKKHVTVEALYSKNNGIASSRKDEELSQKLHQIINGSPRTPKYASDSDAKNQKHKRLKCSGSASVGDTIQTAVLPVEGNDSSTEKVALTPETPLKLTDMIVVDLNVRVQHRITDHPKSKYRESGLPSADKTIELLDISSKKRGRMKQKKLPLSICNVKDQTNTKDDQCLQATQHPEEDNTIMEPSFSADNPATSMLAMDGSSAWKCQAFRAPTVTQNKVMQL